MMEEAASSKESRDINSNESSNVLIPSQKPGEFICPIMSTDVAKEIVERLYGLIVQDCKELNSFDDKNYFVGVDKTHKNPHIAHLCPHGYVLKVLNSKDSKYPILIEAQQSFMMHLIKKGIGTQEPVPNLQGKLWSIEQIYPDISKTGKFGTHVVELRKFVPGKIMFTVPYTAPLFFKIGTFMAEMALAIEDFHHSFYNNHTHLWAVTSVPLLKDYTFVLKDKRDRKIIDEILHAFNTEVVPNYEKIVKGYTHGDPNEQNIIVQEVEGQDGVKEEEKEYNVVGIIDFSDITYSYIVLDLSVNAAYMMIECKLIDQLDVPGHVLAGYLKKRLLTPAEYDVLRVAIASRLAQSLVLGAHAFYLDPGNQYVLTTSGRGWPLLHKYWAEPKESLYARWEKIIESYN